MHTDKILYWGTVAFAVFGLLLFIVNAALIVVNQDLQGQMASRQRIIDSAANVSQLNQQLASALFDASQKTGDLKIRDLLISQGFTLPAPTLGTPAAGAKAPLAPAPLAPAKP